MSFPLRFVHKLRIQGLKLHPLRGLDTEEPEAVLHRLGKGLRERELVLFVLGSNDLLGRIPAVKSAGELGEVRRHVVGLVFLRCAKDDVGETRE